MTTYRIRLQTITPVHIGTGETLRRDFDYVVHKDKTWRLDLERLLAARWAEWEKRSARQPNLRPAALLREEDYRQRRFFRYILPGKPAAQQGAPELRELIKDPWDRPYIPGSSLKGAIRTALAWTAWPELGLTVDESILNPKNHKGQPIRPKFLARELFEKRIFGPDPNRDLMRALHISDLHGPGQPGQGVRVFNVRVVTPRGLQTPIAIEALYNAEFEGTLKIDDALFSAWAAKRLKAFAQRKAWLTTDFIPRLRRYALARLDALARYVHTLAQRGLPGADGLARFFAQMREMQQTRLADNQVFLALGWGTGWDGKTFWTHLQADPDLFARLVHRYRLKRGKPYRKGEPFPSSRKVVVKGDEPTHLQGALGWVLLTFEPR